MSVHVPRRSRRVWGSAAEGGASRATSVLTAATQRAPICAADSTQQTDPRVAHQARHGVFALGREHGGVLRCLFFFFFLIACSSSSSARFAAANSRSRPRQPADLGHDQEVEVVLHEEPAAAETPQ